MLSPMQRHSKVMIDLVFIFMFYFDYRLIVAPKLKLVPAGMRPVSMP